MQQPLPHPHPFAPKAKFECLCQFHFGCLAVPIDKTKRWLPIPITEQIPVWWKKASENATARMLLSTEQSKSSKPISQDTGISVLGLKKSNNLLDYVQPVSNPYNNPDLKQWTLIKCFCYYHSLLFQNVILTVMISAVPGRIAHSLHTVWGCNQTNVDIAYTLVFSVTRKKCFIPSTAQGFTC